MVYHGACFFIALWNGEIECLQAIYFLEKYFYSVL